MWQRQNVAAVFIILCNLHAAALELRTHAFDEHGGGNLYEESQESRWWNEDLAHVVDATKDTVGGAARPAKIHAGILSQAVSQGVIGSAAKLRDGDFHGALEAASGAVTQAQVESDKATRSFRSSVPRLLAVIMLVICIGLLWGIESLLSPLSCSQDSLGSATLGSPSELQKVGEFHHFPALGTLRFLLSLMVLLFNFYPWTVQEVQSRKAGVLSVFSSWGVLAAPMFFTLSGFCQSYAKTVGSKAQLEEDFISAFVVRIMAWYPYYAISLIFLATYFFSYSAWDWSSFTAQFFLISGAFESRKVTFPYLPCSWWFSLLAVYTLGWYPMHTVLKGSVNSVIWTMFTVATTVVIPSVLLEYLFMSEEPLFQMIQYSPSYFFGQALAVWQVKHCMLMQVQTGQSGSPSRQVLTLQPVGEMPFSARFGVTTSCLIMGLVMIFIAPFDELPVIRKPCASIFTKGLLLPVFGLHIVGLCNEADPLARLAARPVVSWAGKLSLSMFLLALPTHVAVRETLGFDGFTWTFLASLLALSAAGYFLIEVPSRRFAHFLAVFMNQKAQK